MLDDAKERPMRATITIATLAAAVLGTAACGDDDETAAGATSTVADNRTGSTTAAPSGTQLDAVFTDSFEDDTNGWGIVDDPNYGTADFAGGDYVWNLTGSSAHLIPETLGVQYDGGELDMRDVVVRADATIESGGGVVGVFCREVPDSDADWQWYEFVARDGFAAIRRADLEGNLDVLAESDDVSLPFGEPIMFEAACIDDDDGTAQLSLTLNGTALLTATDDEPLGNGVSGIQAWTFPVHEPIEVRWHEFSIHRCRDLTGHGVTVHAGVVSAPTHGSADQCPLGSQHAELVALWIGQNRP
jgi:hypothetical protein